MDEFITNLQEHVFCKSIVVDSFADIEDDIDMEGTFVFNRETQQFYGHDGGTWVSFSNPEKSMQLTNGTHCLSFNLQNEHVIIDYDTNPITTITTESITICHPESIVIDSPFVILCNAECSLKLVPKNTNVFLDMGSCEIPIIHEFAILHAQINIAESYPYVNIDDSLPLFFDNISAWQILFQHSYAEYVTPDMDMPSISLETNTDQNTYGFFGGGEYGLPKGLYKLTFTATVYKDKKFTKYEDWNVLLLSKNIVTNVVTKQFVKKYSSEWFDALKANNSNMPFYAPIQQIFFFRSTGFECIAPSITSFSGIYQLCDAEFIIEKIN